MDNQRKNNGQFAEGNKEGNRFTSDNQPENRGRKAKTVSEFLKEYGEGNKIEFVVFDHLDGMYSYFYAEKNHKKLLHLKFNTPLKKVKDYYIIKS